MKIEIISNYQHTENSDNYEFKLGDIVKIPLSNGNTFEAICVNIDKDNVKTFLFKTVVGTMALRTTINDGIYDNTDLCYYLTQGFTDMLPDWIKNHLVGRVEVPSFENIFGFAPEWSTKYEEDSQWELLKSEPIYRLCFDAKGLNHSQAYWTKNSAPGPEIKGGVIDYVGAAGNRCRGFQHIGIRPGFRIK